MHPKKVSQFHFYKGKPLHLHVFMYCNCISYSAIDSKMHSTVCSCIQSRNTTVSFHNLHSQTYFGFFPHQWGHFPTEKAAKNEDQDHSILTSVSFQEAHLLKKTNPWKRSPCSGTTSKLTSGITLYGLTQEEFKDPVVVRNRPNELLIMEHHTYWTLQLPLTPDSEDNPSLLWNRRYTLIPQSSSQKV